MGRRKDLLPTRPQNMTIILKPYSGEMDRARMLALAREHPAGHAHVVDLPYRLCSWAFDNPANVGLWADADGRLMAWAVLQPPFWTVDYAIHPAAPRDAFATLLAWVDRTAPALLGGPTGRPCWFVAVGDGQNARREALTAAGFVAQDDGLDAWSQVTLALSADAALPPCPVRATFHLRPLAGAAEVDAYVALHRAVFESANMTVAWRQAVLRHPAYHPELDLVITDDSGELAAFCVGWLAELAADDRLQTTGDGRPPGDRSRLVGQIEPLGVRADARQHGLAWAILAETVRRLRAMGAATILVQTDNTRDRAYAFYRAAGFRPIEHISLFRKDYAPEE